MFKRQKARLTVPPYALVNLDQALELLELTTESRDMWKEAHNKAEKYAEEAEQYVTEAQMRVLALTRETLEKDKRIEELQEKLNEANRMNSYWQQRTNHAVPATDINTARLADDIKQHAERINRIEQNFVSMFDPKAAHWDRSGEPFKTVIDTAVKEGIKKHLQPGGLLHK